MRTVDLDTTPTSAVGGPVRDTRARSWWAPLTLAVICLLALVLYAWGLGSSWGNPYYSAAVKSMSKNFTNFFFGSFDGAGVVTVDKPPMALWFQVISTLVFGFNRFAVLLPQVIEGVAAVFLLHRTVRRWAGEPVALLAALVLALTPVTVAINKDNNPDTLLVLLLIGAVYAMTRVMENQRRSGQWILLCAFLVGCGFVTKMMQAWIVLPPLLAAYLVGRRASWGRKAMELVGAGLMVVISSFWWAAVTVLWPSPKPYVGGSTDGSALDLIFGYNGFGRIFGGSGNGGPGGGPGGGFGGGGGFSGPAGFLRMFDTQDGGQISWLLPLSLLILASVLGFVLWRWRKGMPIDRGIAAGWIMWGGWLLIVTLVFSFAQGIIHPYYTTMLAPAIAAVTGAGICLLWHRYRNPVGASWLLLPLGVAITVAWSVALVLRDPSWNVWAAYVAAIVGVVAVAGLLLARTSRNVLGRAALVLGIVAILAVPTVWSANAAITGQSNPMGGANPTAGPAIAMGPGGGMGPGGPKRFSGQRRMFPAGGPGGAFNDTTLSSEQKKILDYVRSNAGTRSVPLAVEGGAHQAWTFILNSNLTVVGMGGFMGSDNAPAISQLTLWQEDGKLGFVLVGGGFGGPGGGGPGAGPDGSPTVHSGHSMRGHRMFFENGVSGKRDSWVERSCKLVPPSAYGGTGSDTTQQLYDCRG
jgi:4-amino-4-deoxy-L-arabinose transferase-like glycosyltransferase